MTQEMPPHRRRSIRLRQYDYAQGGAYFVTICTQSRAFLLQNAAIRDIAEQCWSQIPAHFPMVELDEWVVMPNHLHGIVVFGICWGRECRAPTVQRFARPTPCSLPTIIRSFKSAATRQVNALRHTPGAPVWQRNYYEHVVRNEDDLNEIRQYLLNNPVQWDSDEENPDRPQGARHAVSRRGQEER
jgi:REP element-mobilizing transposase RayT